MFERKFEAKLIWNIIDSSDMKKYHHTGVMVGIIRITWNEIKRWSDIRMVKTNTKNDSKQSFLNRIVPCSRFFEKLHGGCPFIYNFFLDFYCVLPGSLSFLNFMCFMTLLLLWLLLFFLVWLFFAFIFCIFPFFDHFPLFVCFEVLCQNFSGPKRGF